MLTSNCYVQCIASLKKTGRLVFSEEVCAPGCVGARILTEAAMNGVNLHGVRLLNLGTGIVTHGKVSELMHDNNIDSAGIIEAAEELCSVNVEVK
jgi:deoxyxylulose-5-phosphate synthase